MRVPLIGSSYQGISVNFESQRSMNVYEEFTDDSGSKRRSMMVPTPALHLMFDSSKNQLLLNDGRVRGLSILATTTADPFEKLIIVAGTRVIKVTHLLAQSNVGTVANDDQIARISQNPTQALIASGSRGYIYDIASNATSAAVVFDVTPGFFVEMYDCVELAGYFLALITEGLTDSQRKIVYSAENNGTLWTSTDYFTAESNADLARRLMVVQGNLWVFGDSTVEVFQPSGDANNPFVPISGAKIEQGIFAPRSAARLGDSLYWLGSDQERGGLTCFRSQGFSVSRVSDQFFENTLRLLLEQYGLDVIAAAVGWTYIDNGHSFYVLNIIDAKTTLVYDASTNRWHERGNWRADLGQYEADLPWLHVSFLGKHVVADRRTLSSENAGVFTPFGAVYEMSSSFSENVLPDALNNFSSTFDPNSVIRRFRRTSEFSGPNHERLFFSKLELVFEFGRGTGYASELQAMLIANGYSPTLPGRGADPIIGIRWSDDHGHTWSNELKVSTGKVGEYQVRAILRRLGSSYDRIFEIIWTEPVFQPLLAGYLDVEVGVA